MKSRTRRPEPVAVDLTVSGVVPAIDALVTRFSGRGTVAAQEIIDALLDLRLVALDDELRARV